MRSNASSSPDVAGEQTTEETLLSAHLRAYLGVWPPASPLEVVGWPGRLEPAWDEAQIPGVVLATPSGTVVSVTPAAVTAGAAARLDGAGLDGAGLLTDEFRERFGRAAGVGDRVSPWVVVRWTTEPADLPGLGAWVPPDDPRLPEWLHAFPDPVLAAFDADGRYLGGVGTKRHTDFGHELAVGTAEEQRGKGLARRLVVQAARDVLARGAVPLYVHHPDNVPSARVADAAGFPDMGWRMLVAWGPSKP